MRKNAILVFIFFLMSTTLLISQNQTKKQHTLKKKQAINKVSSTIINDSTIVMPENLNESITNLLTNWQVDF